MRHFACALAAMMVAMLTGTDQASAYGSDNDWLSGAFSSGGRSAASAERRSTPRRAARVRTRETEFDTDAAPTPRRASRRPAQRQELTSLSGGRSAGSGIASYYWERQRLASGGWFNPNAMTAAHKTLPFGTRVRVTNLNNGHSATVTINDRGPYVAGRVIDLSSAAAGAVGMKGSGLARVKLDILGR